MFGSQALEAAIGLALIFFVLASTASAIVEAIATVFQKRAKDLEATIRAMLAGSPDATSGDQLASSAAAFDVFRGTTVYAAGAEATRQARWIYAAKARPAYLSARSFADAVVEMVGSAKLATVPLPGWNGLSDRLAALTTEAEGDLLHVKAGLESWYDETMGRLGDAYKRWAAAALFVVGLVLAGVGNVSTVDVAERLWEQSAVQQAALDAAAQAAAKSTAPSVPATVTSIEHLSELGLPVGWSSPVQWDAGWLVPHVLGWVITALLLMLGAPFWFDVLSRLVTVRTAGTKPRTAAQDDASATRQRAAAPGAPTTDSAQSLLRSIADQTATARGIPPPAPPSEPDRIHAHAEAVVPDPMRDRAHVTALAKRVARADTTTGTPEHRTSAQWLRNGVAALPPERPTPASTRAFIPRSPQLSLLQAHWDETAPDAKPPLTTPFSRLLRRVFGDRAYVAFAEGPLLRAPLDPEWAKSFLEFAFEHRTARMKFPMPGVPAVTRMANRARVVLVSDWGTGQNFAEAVARQIAARLADAGDRETHLIHLGDVYYAGTEWEAENRFLAYWPVAPGDTRTRSWCLNGNHDMYAAGTGLFTKILMDDRFAHQRTAGGDVTSQLHLRNDHWQILGIDTAWKFDPRDAAGMHGHLADDQVTWLRDSIPTGTPAPPAAPETAGDRMRTILLSHHPAFVNTATGVDADSELLPATREIRTGGRRVDAWFWGHDHRLIRYSAQRELGIDYAVCAGHGAVPEWRDPKSAPAPAGEDRFDDAIEVDGAAWYRCGFTVLDLDDDQVRVTYVDLDGNPWKPEPDVLPA